MDFRGRLGVCLSEMITNIVLGGVATQAMDSVEHRSTISVDNQMTDFAGLPYKGPAVCYTFPGLLFGMQ